MSFCCCVQNSSTQDKTSTKSQNNKSKEIILTEPKKSETPAQSSNNYASLNGGANGRKKSQEPVTAEEIRLEEETRLCQQELQQLTSDITAGYLELTPEMAAEMSNLMARLEAVTTRLESIADRQQAAPSQAGSAGGGSVVDTAVTSPFVLAFDEIIKGPFAEFLAAANKIGGDVQTQCTMVQGSFQALRGVLVLASKCKKPTQDKLMKALEPVSNKLTEIQNFREANRGSAFFNHLSAISESIPAIGWVAVSPAPGPHVKEMSDAGQFYTNRVLKDYRDKDKTHVDWTRAWLRTLGDMQQYIKQHHTTGLTWNQQGVDVSKALSGGSAPPPPGPPPPPAPAPPPPPAAGGAGSDDGARSQLLADLNKGTDATKGLRKVTKDMQTHKNPDLRLHTAVPFKASPKPFKSMGSGRFTDGPPTKPPKCELEGKRWVVEYQQGNKSVVINDTNVKQTVYIFRCNNSTITVKGKVNAITMDGCKKTAVVFDDVISTIDFVNCQSIQAQVTGVVRTVSIDKTDGCQVYLSDKSLDCEIVSAKSSEMNILVPQANGEFKEFALPEQYKTTYNGKNMNTVVSDVTS